MAKPLIFVIVDYLTIIYYPFAIIGAGLLLFVGILLFVKKRKEYKFSIGFWIVAAAYLLLIIYDFISADTVYIGFSGGFSTGASYNSTDIRYSFGGFLPIFLLIGIIYIIIGVINRKNYGFSLLISGILYIIIVVTGFTFVFIAPSYFEGLDTSQEILSFVLHGIVPLAILITAGIFQLIHFLKLKNIVYTLAGIVMIASYLFDITPFLAQIGFGFIP